MRRVTLWTTTAEVAQHVPGNGVTPAPTLRTRVPVTLADLLLALLVVAP